MLGLLAAVACVAKCIILALLVLRTKFSFVALLFVKLSPPTKLVTTAASFSVFSKGDNSVFLKLIGAKTTRSVFVFRSLFLLNSEN